MASPAPYSQARLTILVLGLSCLAANFASRSLEPLVGVLADEFQTSAAQVALLSTGFALAYALIQPILGPVGDAVGKFRVIRICLVVLAVALGLSALAPDLATLAPLRIIAGAAAGGTFPLCIAVVGDRVRMEDRQIALTKLLAAGLTGSAGGALLAAVVEPMVGWRGVSLLCAAVALPAAWFMRSDPPEPSPRRPRLGESLARYKQIWAMPAARKLYACVFIEGALLFGVFPFLAPLLAERGHGGATEAGFAVAAFALGGFGFTAIAPLLLRLWGQRGAIQVGGSTAMAGLLLQAVAPNAVFLILGCLLMGLGFYMLHSSIQTRATEVAPMARGSAVAMHSFSFFMGQSLGPAAMGAGRAVLGPDVALLVAAAGIVLLGFTLAWARK